MSTQVEQAATGARAPRRTVIEPSRGWSALRLGELWRYRELVAFLVWRDLTIRYRQTLLGVAWVLVQPLALMAVFSLFLGVLLDVDTGAVPYPVFALAALVPWTLFSQSLTASSMSLVANANLLGKVYFPRLVLPVSAVGSFLVDFCIGFGLLLGLMALYGIPPAATTVLAPAIAAGVALTALGAGILLSAVNVRYRDVQSGIPLLVQLWLFASPIAYPVSLVPEAYRTLYAVNPLVTLLELFRWALLGTPPPTLAMAAVSLAVAAGGVAAGLAYFRRSERTFADIV